MAEVGFIRTSMPEETRVAILPKEISQLSHPERTFIEQGYARHLGIDDDQYQKSGAKIVSRTEAYDKGAVCVPKPWIDDLEDFKPGQVAMGWFYLAEKKDLARATIDKEMTVIGWQDMYDADKNYTFERNRWFAGYIGVTQALPFAYASPKRLNIGVLGTKNGRVARGAIKRLEEEGLVEGENFETFGRNGQERFRSLLSRGFGIV